MASSKEYLDFVLEQCNGLSARAMMGEYVLYYGGKVIGGVYDNRLLVKPAPSAVALMPDAPRELPYEGAKEKENTQKGVVVLSGLLFIVGFVVAGLDFRFGWSHVPNWAAIAASVILLVAYALYAEVMRENAYLSRTVEVQENQKVIDTGLYGIVRHPMYAVMLWLFLSIPLVLGSWWSFLCFLPYVAVIVVRIRNEEKVLETGLEGYAEYKQRVKYRILPFVW